MCQNLVGFDDGVIMALRVSGRSLGRFGSGLGISVGSSAVALTKQFSFGFRIHLVMKDFSRTPKPSTWQSCQTCSTSSKSNSKEAHMTLYNYTLNPKH